MANPFKSVEDFEKDINSFLRQHKTYISEQGKRISDYFEMNCYNYVVKYYEIHGFEASIENLKDGKFKYKLSPGGYPENFSYFNISLKYGEPERKVRVQFEIHHNLTVQSGFQDDIYLTPDISVINANSIVEDHDHYIVENSKKKFCYVQNKDLQTFCEVKQFNPFPELLFNFIGMYAELKMEALKHENHYNEPKHLAPSLMLSGKGNRHTDRIRESLEARYYINMIFDLFDTGSITFSDYNKDGLYFIGSQNTLPTPVETISKTLISDEDLPF
nr:hypothetical protein [uncultured Flavobacterium sp.]